MPKKRIPPEPPTATEYLISRLFLAILHGDAETVQDLVSNGVDPNIIEPKHGRSPLYAACQMNNIRLVEMLLALGADPNMKVDFRSVTGGVVKQTTPLHRAGSAEVATALLKAGAEVDAVNVWGTTPLISSASTSQLEVVQVLLAAGANPTLRQRKRRNRNADSARNLVEWGIAFNSRVLENLPDEKHRQTIERLVEKKKTIRELLIDAEQKWDASHKVSEQ